MVVFVYDNHEDVEAGGQEGAFPWHTRVRTETRVLLVWWTVSRRLCSYSQEDIERYKRCSKKLKSVTGDSPLKEWVFLDEDEVRSSCQCLFVALSSLLHSPELCVSSCLYVPDLDCSQGRSREHGSMVIG